MGTHGTVEAVIIFKKRRKRDRCQATGFTRRVFCQGRENVKKRKERVGDKSLGTGVAEEKRSERQRETERREMETRGWQGSFKREQ